MPRFSTLREAVIPGRVRGVKVGPKQKLKIKGTIPVPSAPAQPATTATPTPSGAAKPNGAPAPSNATPSV
jgi:hypothetical protein